MARGHQSPSLFDAPADNIYSLPEHEPLSLTRNFIWIVAACLLSLQILPLLVAWMATSLFK